MRILSGGRGLWLRTIRNRDDGRRLNCGREGVCIKSFLFIESLLSFSWELSLTGQRRFIVDHNSSLGLDKADFADLQSG